MIDAPRSSPGPFGFGPALGRETTVAVRPPNAELPLNVTTATLGTMKTKGRQIVAGEFEATWYAAR